MAESTSVEDKFDFYAIFVVAVPGLLVLAPIIILFPNCAKELSFATVPEFFRLFLLIAIALFVGELVAAIGRMLEKPLFEWLLFFGNPRVKALTRGFWLNLSMDDAREIKDTLTKEFGRLEEDQLYKKAKHKADPDDKDEASRIKVEYSHLRSLTMVVAFDLGLFWLAVTNKLAPAWCEPNKLKVTYIGIALFLIFLLRTRQYSIYSICKILRSAEKKLNANKSEVIV